MIQIFPWNNTKILIIMWMKWMNNHSTSINVQFKFIRLLSCACDANKCSGVELTFMWVHRNAHFFFAFQFPVFFSLFMIFDCYRNFPTMLLFIAALLIFCFHAGKVWKLIRFNEVLFFLRVRCRQVSPETWVTTLSMLFCFR